MSASEPQQKTSLSDAKEMTPVSESKEQISTTELKEKTSINDAKEKTSATELKERTSATELKEKTSATELKEKTSANELKEKTSATELKERTSTSEPKPKTSVSEPKPKTSVSEPKEETLDASQNPELIDPVLKTKIADAFDIFDNEGNKTVDSRELGIIIRSLGCCPTDEEVKEVVTQLEEEGVIHFEKFLPVMADILTERKFPPCTEDELIKAFEVLDSEQKSFLTQDEMRKFLMEQGEVFTLEEFEEMLSAVMNLDDPTVPYKDFLPLLRIPTEEPS